MSEPVSASEPPNGTATVVDAVGAVITAIGTCHTAMLAAESDLLVDPLAVVIALDDAVEQGLPVLSALRVKVPGWVTRAEAGRDVAAYLDDALTSAGIEASEMSRILGALRTAVVRAEKNESEQQARVAELQELRERLRTLRRLERLSAVLGELETQRQELDTRIAALIGPVTSAEKALTRGAADVIRLSEESLAGLAPEVQQNLSRAAEAQAELERAERSDAAIREAAVQAAERYAALESARDERIAAMRRHHAADRAVAAALARGESAERGGVESVQRALGEIEVQLDSVDSALARALGEGQQWSPRTPGRWDSPVTGGA